MLKANASVEDDAGRWDSVMTPNCVGKAEATGRRLVTRLVTRRCRCGRWRLSRETLKYIYCIQTKQEAQGDSLETRNCVQCQSAAVGSGKRRKRQREPLY